MSRSHTTYTPWENLGLVVRNDGEVAIWFRRDQVVTTYADEENPDTEYFHMQYQFVPVKRLLEGVDVEQRRRLRRLIKGASTAGKELLQVAAKQVPTP